VVDVGVRDALVPLGTADSIVILSSSAPSLNGNGMVLRRLPLASYRSRREPRRKKVSLAQSRDFDPSRRFVIEKLQCNL
jgi:hypothetical protein